MAWYPSLLAALVSHAGHTPLMNSDQNETFLPQIAFVSYYNNRKETETIALYNGRQTI